MMWMMKYIMVGLANTGPSPIIFPGTISHSNMAHDIGFPVRSAGWVQIDAAGLVKTYGQALSLNMTPHPDDAAIINRCLRDQA